MSASTSFTPPSLPSTASPTDSAFSLFFDEPNPAPEAPRAAPFNPLHHSKASPASFNPINFSSSFVVPRFAHSAHSGVGPLSPNSEFKELSMQSWTAIADARPSPPVDSFSTAIPTITFPYSRPRKVPIPRAIMCPENPVYDLYGSSVVSVNPAPKTVDYPTSSFSPYLAPPHAQQQMMPGPTFDPVALGLPVPPADAATKNVAGLYSASGFDMLGVLARVAARVNPQISIGPVDLSCSFLVVDAKKFDMPIVYASETFSKLTGYANSEIVGRNCRFLQSPDGMLGPGDARHYTDSNAVHHMKTHIQLGRESQSSLINYRKDGSPFINLVTLIPIVWDDESIAYYVGFQVDLVDQPSAILEKIQNGTYVVNYSLINSSVLAPPQQPSFMDTSEETWDTTATVDATLEIESNSTAIDDSVNSTALLEAIGAKASDTDEIDRKQFNRMMLDHCDDFVHVLSLKGAFLYVSPSATRLLEYEKSELIGNSIASVCHPSDIVSVLRELKEAGSVSQPTVSLLYRIRRKNSGLMWLEASGKLHYEHGKGRKCVVLIGRPREVYSMSWNSLSRVGGLGSSKYWAKQYWSKLSLDGMHLFTTPDVEAVLGFNSDELVGTSLSQLTPEAGLPAIKKALADAAAGKAVTLQHIIRTRTGLLEVVTNFHAAINTPTDLGKGRGPFTIIAQTVVFSEEAQKQAHKRSLAAPSTAAWPNPSPLPVSATPVPPASPTFSSILQGLNASSSSAPKPSSTPSEGLTSFFKSLTHPSTTSDNVFDELETTKGTSWQYELASIRLENQSLRKEKEKLDAIRIKKQAAASSKRQQEAMNQQTAASIASARACQNCGRLDVSRAGPTGKCSLCEMCGSRWLKSIEEQRDQLHRQQHAQSQHRNHYQPAPHASSSMYGSPPVNQIPLHYPRPPTYLAPPPATYPSHPKQ